MDALRDKVFIFDFDGTIVDSMDEFADIAARVMPKYFPVDSKAARRMYLETSGIPFFEQLEQLFPNNEANGKAADEFERTKLESYYKKSAFGDVPDTIDHLRSCGARAIVSSNNFQELVDRLTERLGLEFDMVLGFRPNFSKGRDHFSFISNEMGVARDDMVFVGDSIKDGERAEDFGIRFIAKEGTFQGYEFKDRFPNADVIATLADLKAVFTRDPNAASGAKRSMDKKKR